MTSGKRSCWAVRISWAVLGGALGAWLGFGGYLGLAHNADSFASMLALGFFGFFGWFGLFAGAACAALIGGSCEWLLRRLGVGKGVALGAATLVNALALWQIVGLVESNYPGLQAETVAKPQRAITEKMQPPTSGQPRPDAAKPPYRKVCSESPPADAKERAQWNLECR